MGLLMGMFSSSPVTEKAGRLSLPADSSLTMVTPNTVIRPLNWLVSFFLLNVYTGEKAY